MKYKKQNNKLKNIELYRMIIKCLIGIVYKLVCNLIG